MFCILHPKLTLGAILCRPLSGLKFRLAYARKQKKRALPSPLNDNLLTYELRIPTYEIKRPAAP